MEHESPTRRRRERTRRTRRRTIIVAVCALTVAALGGTGAWAVDRYLVEHVQIADVSAYEAEHTAATGAATATSTPTSGASATAAATSSAPVVTDDSYTDGSAAVHIATVTKGSGDDIVTAYVATVSTSDATRVRSAFANDSFGRNITQTTSAIAQANDAIFAINGDYYGFRDTGIVIRNGVVFRDEPARTGLAFYRDGRVEVYDETTTTAAALVADGVWNTVSFGPAIVDGGQTLAGIDDVEVDTNIGNHSIQGRQPRTAVGVTASGDLLFVVVDGRDPGHSVGMTMTELADFMVEQGAVTAYNLDGGGSSTMYFDGAVVNQPSNGGERATSDILYVAGAS